MGGKMKVNATFPNIEDNDMYTVTLNITYNDGVVLQLQPTKISECVSILNASVVYTVFFTETFDVYDVNVVSMPSGMCFSVTYVPGGDKYSFIKLYCGNRFIENVTISGTNMCIDVPPHLGYEILATDFDGDAENKIDTIAPFTTIVGVPNATTLQRISQTGYCNNY